MATARKIYTKKASRYCAKTEKTAMSPVITVRISDEEKERLDKIMINLEIKHYSEIMRMALQMVKRKQLPGQT